MLIIPTKTGLLVCLKLLKGEQFKTFEYLLKYKADTEAVYSSRVSDFFNGKTSIHIVCEQGQLSIVKTLLEHGADPKKVAHNGLTPLHCACNSGKIEIVKQILSKGVPVNTKTPKKPWNSTTFRFNKI